MKYQIAQREQLKIKINTKNDKIMIINGEGKYITRINSMTTELEASTYLGSIFVDDSKIEQELANRVKWSNVLNKILEKRELNQETKLKVYNTIVIATLLYTSKRYITRDTPKQNKCNRAERPQKSRWEDNVRQNKEQNNKRNIKIKNKT